MKPAIPVTPPMATSSLHLALPLGGQIDNLLFGGHATAPQVASIVASDTGPAVLVHVLVASLAITLMGQFYASVIEPPTPHDEKPLAFVASMKIAGLLLAAMTILGSVLGPVSLGSAIVLSCCGFVWWLGALSAGFLFRPKGSGNLSLESLWWTPLPQSPADGERRNGSWIDQRIAEILPSPTVPRILLFIRLSVILSIFLFVAGLPLFGLLVLLVLGVTMLTIRPCVAPIGRPTNERGWS